MDTPGITVRPIKNMSGGAMFAEVFFDDVRVPVENRLGEEGQGWQVTVSALAHERSSIAEVDGLQRKLEELKDLARALAQERPACARGRRHPAPARALRDEASRPCACNGMRSSPSSCKGEPLGAETSINKLRRAELEVELGELALEMQGSAGAHRRSARWTAAAGSASRCRGPRW